MRDLSNRLRRRLARWQQSERDEHVRRQALEIAMERFSKLHAHWHGSCFDLFFIERIPPSALADSDGRTLALEWTRQFRYRDERQRAIDIRQLTPVAECFLRLFETAREELALERQERSKAGKLRQGEPAMAGNCQGGTSE